MTSQHSCANLQHFLQVVENSVKVLQHFIQVVEFSVESFLIMRPSYDLRTIAISNASFSV